LKKKILTIKTPNKGEIKMNNAIIYELAMKHLFAMNEAIDRKDKIAFMKALESQQPNNWLVGNSELSELYVKTYRRALAAFIADDADHIPREEK